MKSGFVAVVGLPNVGKSTLINALIGEKVSIVSSKPQTTRKRTLGILSEPGKHQVVFVDTPGVTDSKEGLNPYLREELALALQEVDAVLAVVGPWEFKSQQAPWVWEALREIKETKPVLFVASQISRIEREKRVPMIPQWTEWTGGDAKYPLLFSSALEGHGLTDLTKELLAVLPEGPAFYEEDIYTPQNLRELSAETVREQCFTLLHQEVPYGLGVQVREFKEQPKITKILADIVLEKDSHKGIVIGRGGEMLKRIGTAARQELEKLLESKVYLELHVVVKDQWTRRIDVLSELGYTHVS